MKSSRIKPRKMQVESLEAKALLTTLVVSNGLDAGPDSFRAAVEAANIDSSIHGIEFKGVSKVSLQSEVEFTGGQRLSVIGNGATIEASVAGTHGLLVSSGGANLYLEDMTLQHGQHGLEVVIPNDAKGTVRVRLNEVNASENVGFGVLVDDQTNHSDARIAVKISDSEFIGNGTGVSDADGVRIQEGGAGGMSVRVNNSIFAGNGGDGLELDETGSGSIRVLVEDSTFDENGFFDEDDLEDGLDIDEAGAGSLSATFVDSSFSGNADEGMDLDEVNDGHVIISMVGVVASANGDEGIKIDEKHEEDNEGERIPGSSRGNVLVSFRDVVANDSDGQEGIEITEEGKGNLSAHLRFVTANSNDKEGIQLSEEDDGNLLTILRNIIANENDDDGIQVGESGRGNLTAVAANLTAVNNDKFGLKVEQEDEGRGILRLIDLLLADLASDDGDLSVDGVRVIGI